MRQQKDNRWFIVHAEGLITSILAAGVFVFSLLACGGPTWVRYGPTTAWILEEKSTVCIAVPKEQLPGVVGAVRAWDTAIHKWKNLQPIIGVSEACDYTIVESNEKPAHPNALATTSGIGGREITLYKGRYEADALGITLHEMGHALGARHMAGTLMAPQVQYNIYKCPDAATVAQVAVANDVDPSLLSWCFND